MLKIIWENEILCFGLVIVDKIILYHQQLRWPKKRNKVLSIRRNYKITWHIIALSCSHLLIFWNIQEKKSIGNSPSMNIWVIFISLHDCRARRPQRADAYVLLMSITANATCVSLNLQQRTQKSRSHQPARCVINTPNAHFSVHIRPSATAMRLFLPLQHLRERVCVCSFAICAQINHQERGPTSNNSQCNAVAVGLGQSDGESGAASWETNYHDDYRQREE